MKHVHIPYGMVLKFYWWRLLVVSIIWFIYDVSAQIAIYLKQSTNFQ